MWHCFCSRRAAPSQSHFTAQQRQPRLSSATLAGRQQQRQEERRSYLPHGSLRSQVNGLVAACFIEVVRVYSILLSVIPKQRCISDPFILLVALISTPRGKKQNFPFFPLSLSLSPLSQVQRAGGAVARVGLGDARRRIGCLGRSLGVRAPHRVEPRPQARRTGQERRGTMQ